MLSLVGLKEGTIVELRDGTFWTTHYKYLNPDYKYGALIRTVNDRKKKTHIDYFIDLRLYNSVLLHTSDKNLDVVKIRNFIPKIEGSYNIKEKKRKVKKGRKKWIKNLRHL